MEQRATVRRSEESLECGHTDFVTMMLSEAIGPFFEGVRWSGWQAEVASLVPLQGISIYPPLWSEKARPIENTSREAIPLLQLVRGHFAMARQLDGQP